MLEQWYSELEELKEALVREQREFENPTLTQEEFERINANCGYFRREIRKLQHRITKYKNKHRAK